MAELFLGTLFFSTLKTLGWPRKTSVFGSVGVPADVLRAAWASTLHSAMAMGAGQPYRACQLISQQFSPTWTTQLADEFFVELDPAKKLLEQPDVLPWDALSSYSLPNLPSDFLKWKDFVYGGGLDSLETAFARGLVFGFLHPIETNVALDVERKRFSEMLPLAIKAGLDVPPKPAWPDNDSYFAWLEAAIVDFESNVQSLPKPPGPLMAAAAVRKRLS